MGALSVYTRHFLLLLLLGKGFVLQELSLIQTNLLRLLSLIRMIYFFVVNALLVPLILSLNHVLTRFLDMGLSVFMVLALLLHSETSNSTVDHPLLIFLDLSLFVYP